MEKFRTERSFRRAVSISLRKFWKSLSRGERDLILTLLLLPWTEREPSSIDSADDRPCPRSSVFLQSEQYGCSTGCTTLDVPEAEQLQLSLSYPLTPLSWFCSSLKPIHSGLTVIRLMTAFGLSAGQQQLSRCDGLNLSFAAIQSEKNWRFAFAAMNAEIPPSVGRFG